VCVCVCVCVCACIHTQLSVAGHTLPVTTAYIHVLYMLQLSTQTHM